MAINNDLVGFLTGIPSKQELTQRPAYTAGGQGLFDVMRRRNERMGDIGNRLRGEKSRAEKQAEALRGLDLSKPEDLQKLASAQKQAGDLKGAMTTLTKARTLAQAQARKEAALKVARAQGNTVVEDYILNGGSVEKAEGVLFRSDRSPSYKTSTLSQSDRKQYDLYLEDIDEDQLEALGIDTPVFGKIDKADKLKIFYNAEDLYTNNPKLGRQAALMEAIRQYGIAQNPVTTGTDQSVQQSSSKMTGAPIR
jgi:hypothetical protein